MNLRQSALETKSRAPFERKEAGGDADVKGAVKGLMTAFEEFKSTNDERLKQIEAKGAADPATEAKLRKIEDSIAGYEGLNQKLTAAESEAKAAREGQNELKAQLDALQLKLQRPGAGDPAVQRKANVNAWARGVVGAFTSGVPNLPEDQRKAIEAVEAEYKALSVGNDTTGGYLAPSEFVAEIIKGVTELSPVRSLARQRTTGNKSIMQPKRTGRSSARRAAELQTRTETTGLAWGMVEINAPEAYALIDISQQNLEDSAFDLEAEIREEAVDQFSVLEGAEFVSGTGVGQMEGILVNADVAETNSGDANLITGDGILSLKYGVKSDYAKNGSFVLNRTTMGAVRRLKAADGTYLWQPGIAQGRPNTIDGDPYVEVPDMPNVAAGAYPIAYGDFRRAYCLVDRIAMQMLRDQYTQATAGAIRFLFRRRVGGQVVLAEAIRKLKVAA